MRKKAFIDTPASPLMLCSSRPRFGHGRLALKIAIEETALAPKNKFHDFSLAQSNRYLLFILLVIWFIHQVSTYK